MNVPEPEPEPEPDLAPGPDEPGHDHESSQYGEYDADGEPVTLVLTGYGSGAPAVAALRAGASDYLAKPADADQLLGAYERARRGVGQEAPPVAVPSLSRVEWEHIQRVLSDCDGNVTRAAALLGLHRRTLQRKLAKRPSPGP